MVKILDQTAPALSQEHTLNFEWGVVEPQWILSRVIKKSQKWNWVNTCEPLKIWLLKEPKFVRKANQRSRRQRKMKTKVMEREQNIIVL